MNHQNKTTIQLTITQRNVLLMQVNRSIKRMTPNTGELICTTLYELQKLLRIEEVEDE